MVIVVIGDKEMLVLFLLGEKYVKFLEKVVVLSNGKIVVFLVDLLNVIKGFMGCS